MYLRADHAEKSLPALRAFIRANPLGVLTTAIESSAFPLLQCSHIPWVLDIADDSSETDFGTLRGHMARANPQAKAMVASAKARAQSAGLEPGQPMQLEKEVMVLFNAPVNHYVTAKFNVETNRQLAKSFRPETSSAYLGQQIRDLSHMAESKIMGFKEPWKVEDAPASYIRTMTKAIVGVEIKITSLGGKWKMSQEESLGDRAGIIQGFQSMGTDAGNWMATTITERCALSDERKTKS
ncbi:hypothetical protein KRP22_012772 [Phytophthora ramorum]|nr:hypothetical protein KRP22_8799 [Phytophthora ramorum]